ncbi:GNAT family N-acetyltransferase [Virgibacillus phasianinus]|uniref:GNAT family N-acetyltransferase n=1 Tax=Virgibacillus phasianinus TaxID=2017483 RepID=A0A220TYW8_9BACI|nr:GNAT family N-acetyltransferase [Virgibacillus phasianinus]ASK60997.1 GNAT family N-acetyltransferase [Virgibacillus phasianinus]
MEIKLLTATDAENYWNLRLEALKQCPEAFATSYEEAISRKNPIEQVAQNLDVKGNYTFGAFENNTLMGMVTLMKERHQKLQHRANIFAMYVTPKKQGKGIGKSLLQEVIETAKLTDEIEKLNLTVVKTNKKAKQLYSTLGFQTFGLEEKALKINGSYYDEEYMALVIK